MDWFGGGEGEQQSAEEELKKKKIEELLMMSFAEVPHMQVLREKLRIAPLAADNTALRVPGSRGAFLKPEATLELVENYYRSVCRGDDEETQKEYLNRVPRTGSGYQNPAFDLRHNLPRIVREELLQPPPSGPGFTKESRPK